MNSTFVNRLIREVSENRVKLGFSFMFIFIFSLVFLHILGFVPEPAVEAETESLIPRVSTSSNSVNQTTAVRGDARPIRISIESVGIDARVETPPSTDIVVLDSALLRGAVHYPGSGTLVDISNIFIFGHSSHLPLVHNDNFRVFNNLEKVKAGDIVRVESSDMVNLYRVRSVDLVSVDEALVEFTEHSKMLTLSTCNSFGEPSDRYVVKADFVTSMELTRPTAYLDNN